MEVPEKSMENSKMSKFLELDFTEFSIDQPGFLKILSTEEQLGQTERNICVCCLDMNGPFVKLVSCSHAGFVDAICCAALAPVQPDLQTMVACRLCHSMLLKILKFQKQVEESLQTLSKQPKNLDQSQIQLNRQINNLQHSNSNTTPRIALNNIDVEMKIEPVDEETEEYKEIVIVPEMNISTKRLKKEKSTESTIMTKLQRINTPNTHESQESTIYLKPHPYNIKSEADIEDQDSDLETNLPLSEMKKEITARRCTNKSQLNNFATKDPNSEYSEQQMFLKSYTKSAHIEQKYEGKISEVILSLEEVRSDREATLSRLKLPFKCLDCVIGFEFQSKFEEHMRKAHMCKGEYKCEICKGRYTKSDIRVHYIRHYIRYECSKCKNYVHRYECSKCNKRYKDSIAAFAHYVKHDDVKPVVHTCKECNMNFTTYRGFRHHLSKHIGRVSCVECQKTFATKAGLRAHMLVHHNEAPRTYECEPCGKVYKEKQTWSRHMKSEHSDSPPPHCDTCQVVFKSDHSLWCHLKSSSKHISEHDKRFVCDHCGMRFIKKPDLSEHINWIHLKRSDHCCSICDKAFMNIRSLRRHIMFVHEKKMRPKNKICDHCGKGFTSHAVLRNHLTIHTGERPHKCDICSATFAQNSALYNHRKLKHKIRPNKETVS